MTTAESTEGTPLDISRWAGPDLDRLFDAAERITAAGVGVALIHVLVRGARLRLLRQRAPDFPWDYSALESVGPEREHLCGYRAAADLLAAIDEALPEPTPAAIDGETLRRAIVSGLQAPLPLEA